jgi:hypothetical protein
MCTMHDFVRCAPCARKLLWAAQLQDMMVQGTSTDGYASLLVIHAASGGICHLTRQLGTVAHLEHEQAAAAQ